MTKNRIEFVLSFPNITKRDIIHDEIVSSMKSVDWNFDEDMVIGARNYVSSPLKTQFNNNDKNIQQKRDFGLSFFGLKFELKIDLDHSKQQYVNKWTEYFDTHGRDVCIVKDFNLLKDIIVSTQGIQKFTRRP